MTIKGETEDEEIFCSLKLQERNFILGARGNSVVQTSLLIQVIPSGKTEITGGLPAFTQEKANDGVGTYEKKLSKHLESQSRY